MERSGWKTNVEISPNCPRCGSCNTKFCYYNNYSFTQPRYFCKSCTRYWTKGGSLRNVPVGGGFRKSRRGKSIRVSTRQTRSRVLPHNHDEHPMTETSSIDLVQVYANFLNQPQEPETRIWVPHQLPNNDSSCHHFSSSSNMQIALNSHGPLENRCLRGGDITDRYLEMQLSYGTVMNFCGLDDGLPPLPGEEGLQLPHMGWLNYEEVIVPNTPQLTRVESKAPYSADELIDNKSSFDMSSYETLFRS